MLGDCYLKYGVGEKKSKSNTYFGHKKPQGGGDRISIIEWQRWQRLKFGRF